MMMRWRMIVRRIAFEGASNLAMTLARGYNGDDGYRTVYDAHGL